MYNNYYHEDFFNHYFIQRFSLPFFLMHLNLRSIKSNLSKLVQYMVNLNVNVDIIDTSEIWLSETKISISRSVTIMNL